MPDAVRTADPPYALALDRPDPPDVALTARAGVPFEIVVRARRSHASIARAAEVPAEVLVTGAGVRAAPPVHRLRLGTDARVTFSLQCPEPGPAFVYVELLVGGEEMASAAINVLVV